MLETHHYLYFIAILSFVIGVLISRKLFRHKEDAAAHEIGFAKGKEIPLLALNLFGIFLLLLYGVWSGITYGLLTGNDIEDLRRTAEIGKGFIKEPGIYFVSISSLLLTGCYMKAGKKKIFGIKSLFIIVYSCFVIFITVAHKVALFLPLLLLLGLYNKYCKISIKKLCFIGFIFIVGIGVVNFMRTGLEKTEFINDLMWKSVVVFAIYDANYVPIVKQVERGEIELQKGREYFQSAILIIPRFLYSEKPVSFDYFLKEKLNRTFSGGGLPPTPVGSLFLNFGLFGVIIGMLTIGLIYNYLYILYITSSYSKSVLLLFLIYYIMNPSQLFGYLFIFLVSFIFIAFTSSIIYKAASFRKRIALSL